MVADGGQQRHGNDAGGTVDCLKAAPSESGCSDDGHIRQSGSGQFGTVLEGGIAYDRRRGEVDACEHVAVLECICSDGTHLASDHGGQLVDVLEGMIADGDDIHQVEVTGKTAASREHVGSDGGDGIGERHGDVLGLVHEPGSVLVEGVASGILRVLETVTAADEVEGREGSTIPECWDCVARHGVDSGRDGKSGDLVASVERGFAYGREVLTEGKGPKAVVVASCEGVCSDLGQCGLEVERTDQVAVLERMVSDCGERSGEVDYSVQSVAAGCTVAEHVVSDGCDTVGELDNG